MPIANKLDIRYVARYLFYETHYPYYIVKYCRWHCTASDLESLILYGVKQTDRTR